MDSWNKYGDECDLRMQMYWFVAIDVLGGVAGIGPSSGQGQSTGGAGRWFPLFSCMMFMFWNDLLINDLLLNPCWMMKWRWSVWLNSGWLLKWLWNVDRVLDECWNNDENVNVLKWLVWGGYIIVLRWILNRLWDVDWAIMNLGCWRIVVWVLWRTYCCILLSVNVTNGCMSISKDLLL